MRGTPIVALVIILIVAAVPQPGAQEVTLPLERFEDLHGRAHPAPTPTPAPPVGFTMDRAWIELEVGEDSARVVLELDLTLFSSDWQRVRLPQGSTFLTADLGTLEGRVTSGTSRELVVRGSGRHTVRLESLLTLAEDEESMRPVWALTLPLPRAAVVAGAIRTHAGVEELELTSGGILRERADDGSWRFAASPGKVLIARLLGARQAPERSTLPLRFVATSSNLAEVALTRTNLRSWIKAEVTQGSLEELSVGVPEGYEVVEVGGGPVAGWTSSDNRLTITPLAPVEDALELSVRLSGEPVASLVSPLLLPDGSARTQVAAALSLHGDGLLEVVDQGSASLPDQHELAALPQELRRPDVRTVMVRDPLHPPQWRVTWPEATEVLAAQIDRMLIDVLVGDAGSAAYQAWVEIRNTGATSLTIGVPPGFELLSAGRDTAALIPGLATDGLVLPLAASASPQVVHLSGLVPLTVPDIDSELTIPMPSLSVPAGLVQVRMVLPGERRYALKESARQGRVEPPPSPAAPRAKGKGLLGSASTARGDGSYTSAFFTDPAGSVTVSASWSALSSTPGPVVLEVEPAADKQRWF